MRPTLLIILLLLIIVAADEWVFQGFVRLIVLPADTGISRIFNIPDERFFQTKLGFRTEYKSNKTMEIVFTAADLRYLVGNIPTKPEFNISDSLIGRRLILQDGEEGLHFYDDPDHVLVEALPFDVNILCLMLDLSLFPYEKTDLGEAGTEPKTLIWTMPYLNQDRCRILERLTATISHKWGENQSFTININRDEVRKEQKTVVTGTADGLGDGIISHVGGDSAATVNLTIHLDKSLLLQEPDREGRLGISEEHDFVLEPKP
jgi:hypothetical protein